MNVQYRVKDIARNLQRANFYPLDVLVIGGTGAGKSSTLNAMFQRVVAKVGRGCDPETMSVSSVELNELFRLWDSPGFGDNIDSDARYAKSIIKLLYEDYDAEGNQYGLIDMVLVILDGSCRDMGTAYKLLNEVVIPNFQVDRILVAINQADVAMKGRHWDEAANCPDEVLLEFLNEKRKSVRRRLKEATGTKIVKPVCYSAERGYNIEKLLDMIIDNMPAKRRKLVY